MTTETLPVDPEITDPPVDPVDPVDPEPKPEPEEPEPTPTALNPVTLSEMCLAAGEPDLIPLLLQTPHTPEQVQARIAQAREIRKICALAKLPDIADRMIAAGATPDDAKLETWSALVRRSESAPVDNTPPPANALTRAAFEAMSPAQRGYALRAGRRIVD